MNIEQIKNKTAEAISNYFKIASQVITDNTTLSDLGADYLDKVEVVLGVEKKFGILIFPQASPDVFYNSSFENLCLEVQLAIENKSFFKSKMPVLKRK